MSHAIPAGACGQALRLRNWHMQDQGFGEAIRAAHGLSELAPCGDPSHLGMAYAVLGETAARRTERMCDCRRCERSGSHRGGERVFLPRPRDKAIVESAPFCSTPSFRAQSRRRPPLPPSPKPARRTSAGSCLPTPRKKSPSRRRPRPTRRPHRRRGTAAADRRAGHRQARRRISRAQFVDRHERPGGPPRQRLQSRPAPRRKPPPAHMPPTRQAAARVPARPALPVQRQRSISPAASPCSRCATQPIAAIARPAATWRSRSGTPAATCRRRSSRWRPTSPIQQSGNGRSTGASTRS